jgi:hypothetical protein
MPDSYCPNPEPSAFLKVQFPNTLTKLFIKQTVVMNNDILARLPRGLLHLQAIFDPSADIRYLPPSLEHLHVDYRTIIPKEMTGKSPMRVSHLPTGLKTLIIYANGGLTEDDLKKLPRQLTSLGLSLKGDPVTHFEQRHFDALPPLIETLSVGLSLDSGHIHIRLPCLTSLTLLSHPQAPPMWYQNLVPVHAVTLPTSLTSLNMAIFDPEQDLSGLKQLQALRLKVPHGELSPAFLSNMPPNITSLYMIGSPFRLRIDYKDWSFLSKMRKLKMFYEALSPEMYHYLPHGLESLTLGKVDDDIISRVPRSLKKLSIVYTWHALSDLKLPPALETLVFRSSILRRVKHDYFTVAHAQQFPRTLTSLQMCMGKSPSVEIMKALPPMLVVLDLSNRSILDMDVLPFVPKLHRLKCYAYDITGSDSSYPIKTKLPGRAIAEGNPRVRLIQSYIHLKVHQNEFLAYQLWKSQHKKSRLPVP